MKKKLYIDFDGVIMNTIEITYQMMKDQEIELTEAQARDFYLTLDWDLILKRSHPIEDSFRYLKELQECPFYDVFVLTHVNSIQEQEAKKKFLREKIPNLEVICVPYQEKKCDVVDCDGAILVDDYMKNLEFWQQKGGIPVKFSSTGKKYDCFSIHNLGMLMDLYDEFVKIK